MDNEKNGTGTGTGNQNQNNTSSTSSVKDIHVAPTLLGYDTYSRHDDTEKRNDSEK